MTRRTKAEKLADILDAPAVEVTAGNARRHYLPDHGAGDPRGVFQRYPAFYALIHDIVTPTLALDSWEDSLPDPDVGVVVNLGSGCRRLHPEMINVDMVAFPTVDLVADFQSPLPIRSGTVLPMWSTPDTVAPSERWNPRMRRLREPRLPVLS